MRGTPMGTWDVDAFGNDSACDWAAQFAETGTLELLAEELEDAASTRGFYRQEALVACGNVARLPGGLGERRSYNQAVDALGLPHPAPPFHALLQLAIRA